MRISKSKFVPECFRACLHHEKFEAAKVPYADEPTIAVSSAPNPQSESIGYPVQHAVARGVTPASPPNCEPSLPIPRDLRNEMAEWFINEVDAGLRQDVADETRFQIRNFPVYKRPVMSCPVAQVTSECRPIENLSTAPEMIDFYAEWAIRWLLALNPDHQAANLLVGAGLHLASEKFETMDQASARGRITP